MPTEARESISSVKPSGWINVEYGGQYLYNRCHLIGFQLTGENANERNLITGTRYMNVEGMLPFENLVADYVKETENHVLYRVTPVFQGEELVARGVEMEAFSVEDQGEGVYSTSTAITTSRGSPSTMPLGRAAWPRAGGRGRVRDRGDLHPEHQVQKVPSARLLRRVGYEPVQPGGVCRRQAGAAGSGLYTLRHLQAIKPRNLAAP